MRKYLIVLALAGTLTMGGCATTSTGTSGDFIRQVQAIATTICQFVPTAATVTAIWTAGQFTLPFAIAQAICDAVLPVVLAGKRRAGKPVVSGVTVRGYWVK